MAEPPIPLEPRNDPYQQAMANLPKLVFKRLLHFDQLPSTNSYVKKRGAQGDQEGLVVLANTQTSGQGRFERSWHSPKGGLYFSVLLRPTTIKAAEIPLITLTAGVAIAKVLQTALGIQPQLRWPNDVLIDDQKVAGVLSESTYLGENIEFTVLGIGVNVNTAIRDFPKKLQQTAISIQDHLGRSVKLPRLFSYIIGQLEFWYLHLRDKGFPALATQWRKLCNHLGHTVRVDIGDTQIVGTSQDIAMDGSLILQARQGRIQIRSGDVHKLRKALD